MPVDLTTIAQPQQLLVAWAAGLALVSGIIAMSRIVGPGFSWLAVGISILVGLPAMLTAGAWWARAGLLLAVLSLIWARNRPLSGILQVVAGLSLLAEAMSGGAYLPGLTATLALGGVTGEMLLGHWYLIDPRLPRSALRLLALGGIVGLVTDSGVLAFAGLPGEGPTVAFWVLTATSVVLMAAVMASLRYPAYAGVMAATGLSYLAVLTTLGEMFLGRALVAGLGTLGT